MKRRSLALLLLGSVASLAGVAVISCVGDTPVLQPVPDGGTGTDSGGADTSVGMDGSVADSSVPDSADTGPAIDGSYAFSSHWDTFTNSGSGADSIAALPSGGFVVGGSYTGSVAVIGAYGLPAAGAGSDRNAYLTKLDASGNVTAAIGFGGPSGNDEVTAVAADAAGDLYVAGYTFGGFTLNGTALTSGSFVVKLNGTNLAAAPMWSRSYEISIPCGSCLAVGTTDVDLIASFPGTVHYGGGQSVTSNGGFDVLVLKLDASNGTTTWGSQIGSTADDLVGGIAMDSAQNMYITESYQAATLLSGQALGTKTPTGPGTTSNLLVAKLDASHAPVYAYAYGDPGGTGVASNGIAVDGTGRVAVLASFNGGVDFGLGATGSSGTDGVVFVVDEAKSKTVWQQVIGSTGADRGVAVRFDPWGHLVVTGTYTKTPSLGAFKLVDGGLTGTYIAKFNPAYAVDWFTGFAQMGSAGSVVVDGLAVTSGGTCAVSGGLAGSTDFGGGMVTAISTGGTADSFVAGRHP